MPDASSSRSAAPRAVFVSYSHDDAAAARRTAEALRAAGLEVWFDESELRSGDTWDANIKQQIRDCALFLPIISQNTQRRREGYFRLEWHLAEERSRLIARGTPFLVPVAIDDTTERGALVPEVFLSVQWTRLPGGEGTAAFGERIKQLLAGEIAPTPSRHSTEAGRMPPLRQATHRRISAGIWIAGLATVAAITIAGYVASRPSSNADSAPRSPAAEKPAAVSTIAPAPAAPRLGPKSIAVLPFDNLSEDKDASAFFADGMHDDVISSLLLIRELRPIPRATVMTYRGTKKTPRDIADELGVAFLLNGTVRRAGEKIRITATLFNPRTDETLWNKPYNKDVTEIFAIQAELAQAIAAELKAALSPEEKKQTERRPTENVAAYDLYLKARDLRYGLVASRTSLKDREALAQAAVALDPKFALAWGELSYAHGYNYRFDLDRTPTRLARAKEAIEAATRWGGDDPDVMLFRGYYHYFCFLDYEQAKSFVARAALRLPSSPAPVFAQALILRRQGTWPDTLLALRKAAQIDPRNYDIVGQWSSAEIASRHWDAAVASLRQVQELRPGSLQRIPEEAAFWATGSTVDFEALLARSGENSDVLLRRLAVMRGDLAEIERLAPPLNENGTNFVTVLLGATAMIAQGKTTAAHQFVQAAPAALKARLASQPDNASAWADLGLVEAILGRKEEALRDARKAVELAPMSSDAHVAPGHQTNLAVVMAWTGNQDGALDELERLLKIPAFKGTTQEGSALLNVHVMRHHPFFFPLRGHPRFEALLNDPKNNGPLF